MLEQIFLNCDLFKDVYMVQPVSFQQVGKGNLVCKLKKPIYGLKQASRQWYLKFEEVITRHSFKENVVDRCIYMKVSESCFIFLVLYVDDILLATNETDMLAETNQMLCNHFDMKYLGEASFVLGIKIVRVRTNHVLQLSQRAYNDRILKRFDMHNCSLRSVSTTKGERLSKD